MSINRLDCGPGSVYQGLTFNKATGELSIFPNGNTVDLSGLVNTDSAITSITDLSLSNNILSITYVGPDGVAVVKSVFLPYGVSDHLGVAPIVVDGGTGEISITQANATTNGYLSSVDWNIFNNKMAFRDDVVYKNDVQTLTNKTLTNPVITGPTGITKTDVGLGNVINVNTTNATNITSGTLLDSLLSANVALKNINNNFSTSQTITGNLVVTGTTNGASAVEMGYLAGVTSAIQTQLNGKQATLVNATNLKSINNISLLGSGNIDLAGGGGGTGDVVGPAASLDNALPRFDGTGGKTLQASGVIVDDSDNINIPGTITNTALTTALGLKAPLASPTFTGTVVLPSTTSIGTITNTELSYVDGVTSSIQTQLNAKAASVHTHAQADVTNLVSDLAAKAPLASPTFTGTPTLPTGTIAVTQAVDDNTTKVATTAYVIGQGYSKSASPTFTGTVVLPSTTSIGSVSSTEISHLDGVTNSIQLQIDTKVAGPASATDEALVRFDLATGKLVQNSNATLSDTGLLTLTNTTEQLRVRNSATDYFKTTVASNANTTFDLVAAAGTPTFTFSKAVIGSSGFVGTLTAQSGAGSNFTIHSPNGIATVASTDAEFQLGVSTNTVYRTTVSGNASTALVNNSSYVGFLVAQQPFTTGSAGTHPLAVQFGVKGGAGAVGTAGVTDSATVFIDGALTGLTPSGRNDALRVAGTSYFNGNIVTTGTINLPGGNTGLLLVSDVNGNGSWANPSIMPPDGTYVDIVVSGVSWTLSAAAKTGLWSATATLTNKTIDGTTNTFQNIPSSAIDTSDTEEFGASGVPLPSIATPGTTVNSSTIFSQLYAGRHMMGQIAPSGYAYKYQPFVGRGKVAWLSCQGNVTTIDSVGLPFSAVTTAARSVATTNLFTSVRRAGMETDITAGASRSLKGPAAQWFLGSSAGMGGFTSVFQVGISHPAAVANARGFVGMYFNTAVIGNQEPTSITRSIGFAFNAGETVWKVISNDATGTATTHKTLSASFPSNTLSADWYVMTLHAPSGQSTNVYWHILNVSTGAEDSGTISSDLPAANQLLNYHVWINNGVTALAAAIDISTIYIETEN